MTPAGLITTAKAMAPHVVAWVAEDEPIGYLTVNRTKRELIALVAVLAETIAHCKDGEQILTEVCAARDDTQPANRGMAAKWSRPDDGIVDEVAIELVVAGESTHARPVPLSHPERVRAAARITEAGEGPSIVAKRLHVSAMTAWDLRRQALEMDGSEEEDVA